MRLRRIVRTLLAAMAVLVTAVALSLPVDAWWNRGRVDALTNAVAPGVAPAAPGVRLHLARPPAPEASADPTGPSRWPAVVMIHEFWGLNEALVSKADLLAAQGYVVAAPDTLRGTTTRYFPKALWHTLSTPETRVVDDLDAVVAWLAARPDVDPQRIVVMGFCYGGGKALAYALARPTEMAGTAVFYGDPTSDADALSRLRGPVLGVFGERDTLVTPAEVDAFERALVRAGAVHELHRFAGVGHAFVTSATGIATDPVQAAAWRVWLDWLAATVAVSDGGAAE